MKDILQVVISAYTENINELLQKPVALSQVERFLPNVDDKCIEDFKSLIRIIPPLAKLFVDFVNDSNNLIEDRAKVSAALNYLIMPFDVISDDNGVIGFLDDAIIMMSVAKKLSVPTRDIQTIVAEYRPVVSRLEDVMPSWLIDSLCNIENALSQMKSN